MADFGFPTALASMLLTLSVFLVCPEESLSKTVKALPLGILTADTKHYVGVHGDVPHVEIRLVEAFISSPQWYYANGSIHWERNHRYCLSPICNTGGLMLRLCSCAPGIWIRESSYIYNSRCDQLVLTRSHGKIYMSPRQNTNDQFWFYTFQMVSYLKRFPRVKYPMSSKGFQIVYELLRSQVNTLTPIAFNLIFPRDVATFPGTVSPRAPRVSRTVSLKVWRNVGNFNLSTHMTTPEFWQPTQLYAPPGKVIEVLLPKNFSLSEAKGIILRIGAHNEVQTRGQYLRMPIVSEHYMLYPGLNKVRSQYGGNLIFKFVTRKHLIGDVTVKKVVEAPYFELGVTGSGMWRTLRRRGAPYTVLVGRRCVIIGSTKDARTLRDPELLLKNYDRNIMLADRLSSFDRSDPPPAGRLWFINGIQPECPQIPGVFPISVDRHVFNLLDAKAPNSFFIFRHIGYAYYQRLWESLFGRGALANLFGLYLHEQIFKSKHDIVTRPMTSRVHQELKTEKTYQEFAWREKLVFFKDLMAVAPKKGWGLFRHLHRRGRRLTKVQLEDFKNDPRHTIEFVYSEFSLFAKKDFYSVFRRWGFKIRPETLKKVRNNLHGS